MDTKNLKTVIETVKAMYTPSQIQEQKEVKEASMMKDDGKVVHNCAKHVEHAEWGQGNCISEEHADPDRYGNIAWYDIEFPHGIEKGVPVSELKVLQAESHMHSSKKSKKMAEAIEGDNSRNTENDKAKENTLNAVKASTNKTLDNQATPGLVAGAKVGGEQEIIKQGVREESEIKEMSSKEKMKRGLYNKEEAEEVDEQRFKKGEDIGKPGMNFAKIAKSAAKRYGSKEAGQRVAGAVMKKVMAKEDLNLEDYSLDEIIDFTQSEEYNQLDELSKKTLQNYVGGMMIKSANMGQEIGAASKKGISAVQKPLDKFNKKLQMVGLATKKLAKEEVEQEESVDETIIYSPLSFEIKEADQGYDAYFRAYMKKHGISSVADFKTPEEKKAFFNKVDAGYKAKNEEVFLEAMMSKEIQDKIATHEKGGNKVSDKQSNMKSGQMEYSFVVTRPDGKKSRHIYHGSSTKVQSMQGAS